MKPGWSIATGAMPLAMLLLAVSCAAPEPPERVPESAGTYQEILDSSAVRVGLERLEDGEADVLQGQRLGLVVHAASVTVDGRHAIDVLRELDLEVVRLFSPEHGLRGRAAAGEQVEVVSIR